MMVMRRRDFVAGSVALSAGGVVSPYEALAQAVAPGPRLDRIIDAHCHVFNADDVPIEGFVKRVIVPRVARSNQLMARFQEYPGALEALVRALAVQMKVSAPDSRAELLKIDEIERDPRKRPTPQWRRAQDLANLKEVFRRIWRDKNTFQNLPFGQAAALEVALENIQLFLVQQVYSEFGRPVLTPDDRDRLRTWPYENLAVQLYPRDDLVGRYIRWALLFTRFRSELIDELDQVHQLARKSRVVLMVPSSVDLSKWLDDESHTSLAKQVNIMNRLARRKRGPRIHGFVGFDPLRQTLYERGRRSSHEDEPLALLRTAIEGDGGPDSGGAIGVKLYPPMGFRATDNALLEDRSFNEPHWVASTDRGIGPQVGANLDRTLSRLYAWCGERNIPIMAHANDSFGPTPEYEQRANPEYWRRVLRPEHQPNLRINMAHFGHFNRAIIETDVRRHVKDCWEWTVGEIMAESNDSYAYADISSISEILKPGPSRKILECMQAFRETFKNSADRLIYGTDWSMIAQSEGFPKLNAPQPYPDLMVKFLTVVGYSPGEIEAIMFRNATRFLGLSRGERAIHGDNCTRGRLEKFYAANSLNANWMAALD
jgi:predicted TIM-barrel fold metal-dependent hydrolase